MDTKKPDPKRTPQNQPGKQQPPRTGQMPERDRDRERQEE